MSEDVENKPVGQNLLENGGEHITRTGENRPDRDAALKAVTDYLATVKRYPNTIAANVRWLKRFFAFLDRKGIADLRSVKRADVLEYRDEVIRMSWSTHTKHAHLGAVRQLYTVLDNQGKVLMNPTFAIAMPRLERALPRNILTRSEVRQIMAEPDTSLPAGIRDRTMLEVFYSTGIRVAELCHLTVHDVDLLNGYLRINSGKGCKDRVVPLGKHAKKYIAEYMRHVRGLLTRKSREERALFVGNRQHGLTTTRVNQLVRFYAKKAGIKKRVSPHVFRHTFATHLLEAGADISQVQRLLGHVLINTTQIYTRVTQPEVKRTHGKTHPRERQKEH